MLFIISEKLKLNQNEDYYYDNKALVLETSADITRELNNLIYYYNQLYYMGLIVTHTPINSYLPIFNIYLLDLL